MATNFVSETEDSQTTNMVKKEEAPLLTDSGKKLLRYTKRFYALFLICSVEIGYNFSTGFAGPLENAIIARTGIQKKSIIGLFTSLYSLPNIFLPLVAGIVVDKLGPRVCITVFCSIIMFGLIIAMIGGFLTGEASMIVLQTGNFVFALGAECLFVAYSNYKIDKFLRYGHRSLVFREGAGLCLQHTNGSGGNC
jgi:MFS family permease